MMRDLRNRHEFVKLLDFRWMALVVFAVVICFSTAALATEEGDVEQAFVKFQHDWIQKLTHQGNFGKKSIQVKEDSEHKGRFVASYYELTEPFEYRIRKTGQKGSPYVGVIRYHKIKYLSTGKTPDEASQGEFKRANQSIVTEIFRFSKGKWVY